MLFHGLALAAVGFLERHRGTVMPRRGRVHRLQVLWWPQPHAQPVGCAIAQRTGAIVGAGLSREAGDAVYGTGFAGVRGTSPLPQSPSKINKLEFVLWEITQPFRAALSRSKHEAHDFRSVAALTF